MTIEMINKNKFRVASDKKLLRKVGKQWVTVSALTLMLLGGGALASSVVTHAASTNPAVEAQDTNSVKKQINSNLDKAYQATQSASDSNVSSSSASSASVSSANKPSNIQSQATNMYRGLMLNATKPSNSTSVSLASSKSNVASSGSVSSSSKPSFNSAYQSYMAKMSGTDSKVASANDSNAQSNNENIKKPLLKDNAQPNYFSGNVIRTGNDDGLNYKVYQNGGVEFTDGTANSDLSDFSNSDVRKAKAIKFDDDIIDNSVTNEKHMFSDDSKLEAVDLESAFCLSVPQNRMFYNDSNLRFISISKNYPNGFLPNNQGNNNTTGDNNAPISGGGTFTNSNNQQQDMFTGDIHLQQINIGDSSIQFNSDSKLGSTWFKASNYTRGITTGDTGANDNYINLDDSQSHVGDWKRTPISTTVNYQYNGNTLASQYFSVNGPDNETGNGYSDLDVNNTNDTNIPKGYHLVNTNTMVALDGGTHNVPITLNQATDTINFVNQNNTNVGTTTTTGTSDTTFEVPNVPSGYHVTNPSSDQLTYDGQPHTVHVIGDTIKGTATIHLIYNVKDNDGNVHTHSQGVSSNKPNYTSSDVITKPINTQVGDTVTFKPSQFNKPNYSTNDSDWTINFTTSDAPVDKNDDFNQSHTFTYINQKAIHQEVRYIDITNGAQMTTSGQFAGQYNTQSPIGPVVGIQNVSDIGIIGQYDILEPKLTIGDISLRYISDNQTISTKTISGNIGSSCNISNIARNNMPSADGGLLSLYNIQNVTDLHGNNVSSATFQSNPQTFDVYLTSLLSLSEPKEILSKEHRNINTINANGQVYHILQVPAGYTLVNNENPFKLADNGVYNVAVKEKTASDTINYTDNGKTVSTTKINGHQSTNTDINALNAKNIPQGYHLANAHNSVPFDGTTHDVDVVGDMVGGTATINLIYQRGKRSYMRRAYVNLSSNIGDPDIVINPQTYDKQGYQISSASAWHIPFDYNTVNTISHGDLSRYNRENTFIYKARPTDITIQYVDTQTNQPVNNPDDLGQIAYDGDTIDLEDTNASNGFISVDGNNYRLNLPSGYHLAHSNNYIKVTASGTYVKKVSNNVGGFRMVRMPLMKLTLGITPHFRKPTSNSSITPVKPSSASSVAPQSASSASTEPSSASVVPSSASQSVVPSISTASSMIAPSSTASVAPVTYSVAPSSIAPASISIKPSSISTNKTIARSIIRHVSHKHATKQRVRKPVTTKHAVKSAAKHDSERLNHQITQGKHKLNIVEHHMEARKATEIKMAHMLVHAKKTIKRSKHKLTYLRHNKRHVKHTLRRITRNKVAIKHAKRVVRTAKQARPRFVHAKAASVEPTTDKSAATSVKAPVITPKVHAKSTATVHTNRKKLPQTSEATDHAGIVAIILMVMSVILAGFDKVFSRKHNE